LLPLLLSPGDAIEVQDKRTGHRWHGTVDIVAPEQGRLWIYAELGERKLVDTEIHNIHKPADRAETTEPAPENQGTWSICTPGH
jgi:hypothetical protein